MSGYLFVSPITGYVDTSKTYRTVVVTRTIYCRDGTTVSGTKTWRWDHFGNQWTCQSVNADGVDAAYDGFGDDCGDDTGLGPADVNEDKFRSISVRCTNHDGAHGFTDSVQLLDEEYPESLAGDFWNGDIPTWEEAAAAVDRADFATNDEDSLYLVLVWNRSTGVFDVELGGPQSYPIATCLYGSCPDSRHVPPDPGFAWTTYLTGWQRPGGILEFTKFKVFDLGKYCLSTVTCDDTGTRNPCSETYIGVGGGDWIDGGSFGVTDGGCDATLDGAGEDIEIKTSTPWTMREFWSRRFAVYLLGAPTDPPSNWTFTCAACDPPPV